MEQSITKSARQYSEPSENNFNVGDLVFLYSPNVHRDVTPKLASKWTGPWIITENKPPLNHILRPYGNWYNGRLLTVIANVDRMRKWKQLRETTSTATTETLDLTKTPIEKQPNELQHLPNGFTACATSNGITRKSPTRIINPVAIIPPRAPPTNAPSAASIQPLLPTVAAQRSPSHNKIITPTRTRELPFDSPWPPTPQSPPFHGFQPPAVDTSPPFHGFRTPVPSPHNNNQHHTSPQNQRIPTPEYPYIPDEPDALMPTPTAEFEPHIPVQPQMKYFPPSPIDSPPTPADVILPPPLQRCRDFTKPEHFIFPPPLTAEQIIGINEKAIPGIPQQMDCTDTIPPPEHYAEEMPDQEQLPTEQTMTSPSSHKPAPALSLQLPFITTTATQTRQEEPILHRPVQRKCFGQMPTRVMKGIRPLSEYLQPSAINDPPNGKKHSNVRIALTAENPSQEQSLARTDHIPENKSITWGKPVLLQESPGSDISIREHRPLPNEPSPSTAFSPPPNLPKRTSSVRHPRLMVARQAHEETTIRPREQIIVPPSTGARSRTTTSSAHNVIQGSKRERLPRAQQGRRQILHPARRLVNRAAKVLRSREMAHVTKRTHRQIAATPPHRNGSPNTSQSCTISPLAKKSHK